MSFNRAYEFERCDFGPAESNELQDSFEKNLSKQSTSSVGQVQSSLTRSSYLNQKKTTVAEMVADLIERTGLTAYQKEVKAIEESKSKKIAEILEVVEQKQNKEPSLDGPSIIDLPGVQEAIMGYIKRYVAHQKDPVLNFVTQEIKPTLQENNDGSLGDIEEVKRIINQDSYSDDPRLSIFVVENLLNNKTRSLSDFTVNNNTAPTAPTDDMFDILTPSSKY